MFGKIISVTRTFRDSQTITSSQFVEMPKTSLVDGTVVDNTTAARAGWRNSNGWKDVVDDTCQCTNEQCPVFSHYCHSGCEHWDSACPYNETCPQDGKIHRRFAATSTSDADAVTIARSIESEGVAQMTKQQQSYILEKLAKVVAKTASCLVFALLSVAAYGDPVTTTALGNLTDTSIVVTNVDLSTYSTKTYAETHGPVTSVNGQIGDVVIEGGGSGDASFVYYGDVQLTNFKMTGESVTYPVHDAIGGDGVKRYAAKFPSIEGVSFKLHSVSNFNPLVDYFNDTYTTKQHFLSKVYSLGSYDVDEDLYEYATYLCKPMSRYVSDPDPEHVFPLSFILVKNMIGGLGARFVSTSVEDTSFTITVNSNEVSISNIHISNATNVFYSWSYYDEYYITQSGVSEARISIDDTKKTDMKVYMVGDGSPLVTEDTKYDGTSELVIRTGKAGERGTGYGYKIFKGTTEELYWKVYVRNAGISHDVSDKSYSLPRGYPYYELRLNQPLAWGPSMVLIDTEVYSTEGTYENNGCSNVTYYVDLHTGLYSERGYGCSLIVSNVMMTGTSSNVTVLPNPDVMVRSGNYWVNPNFVPMRTGVRFAVGSYYNTYSVTNVKIPCQADGSIVCTVTAANSLKIPITYTCSSRLGSTTHNSYLIVTLSDVPWVKTFFDTRVANVRNNNMAYDSVLKCTWELKVTNGCFYAEIVSGEDYREGGL